MCRIAGVFGKIEGQNILPRMIEKLQHRGLDSAGRFHANDICMAHGRLAVIDMDGGSQSIFNEDGSICIVLNGAIYNSRSIRNKLAEKHQFTTSTDAEAVLHLYEEVGEECVKHLDGMFAFAVYDAGKGLMLARDPLGIKPLYRGEYGGAICFASEIKALCNTVPNFSEFPAGHYYTTALGMQKYFSIGDSVLQVDSQDKAVNGVRYYLREAVRKCLISDAPLGVFLSGGLDSSIIAALASKRMPGLKSFSVGMAESMDREYARLCANYLGTEHYELVYTQDDMLSALPQVIYHLESYDAALVRSAIPNYFLCKLAGGHIKVVLSGEGADELFGGYHYLKGLDDEALSRELVEITESLHNTSLQRCDRMPMAHGIEARAPFLDMDMLKFAFSMPLKYKMSGDGTEKWVLREAFKDDLPKEVVCRQKSKFSEGCGSSNVLAALAAEAISDKEFERERTIASGRVIPSKEELIYYRVFEECFGKLSNLSFVGHTRDAPKPLS